MKPELYIQGNQMTKKVKTEKAEKLKTKSPFDYIDNISANQNYDSIWDETSEKTYNTFMINRGLSQYKDTILFSQVMNEKSEFVSPKMQYDFYRHGITYKKKRFAKWYKTDKLEHVQELSDHFGINKRVMEGYVSLMSEKEFETLLGTLERGGRNATTRK